MKVWSIANQKGGVGKTTSTISLASHLARRGNRVLMLDMDPHGSLTAYFGFDPDTIRHSAYSLFSSDVAVEEAARVVRRSRFEGLDLIPAATAMATLDRQLGAKHGTGLVVARSLEALSDRYDYALIDCPPMLGVLMVNALAACSQLIIPVQAEFLALKGLDRMLYTLKMILKARKHPLEHIIVPTFFDRRTRASVESLNRMRDDYGDEVWSGMIPIDTQFREASSMGTPLPLFNAGGRGAVAYGELLDHLLPAAHQQEAVSA